MTYWRTVDQSWLASWPLLAQAHLCALGHQGLASTCGWTPCLTLTSLSPQYIHHCKCRAKNIWRITKEYRSNQILILCLKRMLFAPVGAGRDGRIPGSFLLGDYEMRPCHAFKFPQKKESVPVYLLEGWRCNQKLPPAAARNPPEIN